jgi:hypothetical protein
MPLKTFPAYVCFLELTRERCCTCMFVLACPKIADSRGMSGQICSKTCSEHGSHRHDKVRYHLHCAIAEVGSAPEGGPNFSHEEQASRPVYRCVFLICFSVESSVLVMSNNVPASQCNPTLAAFGLLQTCIPTLLDSDPGGSVLCDFPAREREREREREQSLTDVPLFMFYTNRFWWIICSTMHACALNVCVNSVVY